MEDVEHILEEHSIKPTANRMLILKTLLRHQFPVSMADIEMHNIGLDKSSISRVLTLFKENHLVHVISGGDGVARYEYCHSTPGTQHDDEHIHFYCQKCGRLICLEKVPMPILHLPEGYSSISVNCVVHGICPRCEK